MNAVPGLEEVLYKDEATVLHWHDQATHPIRTALSEALGLPDHTQSVLLVSLTFRQRLIGLLVLGDMRKTEEGVFTPQQVEFTRGLAAQCALLIDRIQETQLARNRLTASLRASTALVASPKGRDILQEIVEHACQAANATNARVILLDKHGFALLGRDVAQDEVILLRQEGRNRIVAEAHTDKPLDLTEHVRLNGLSMQVMQSGQPVAIENALENSALLRPALIAMGVRAFCCLPLIFEDRPLGVMSFYYDRPHRFPPVEVEALQFYANHAAAACVNARRMEMLESMWHTAADVAKAVNVPDVLRRIIKNARELLHAQSASIMVYDSKHGRFVQKASIGVDIPRKASRLIWQQESEWSAIAKKAMEDGWVGVQNVDDAQWRSFIPEPYREYLRTIDTQSFQGVTLAAEAEPLGILFVNYSTPRSFGAGQRAVAQAFANHMAVVLKKTKLLDQLHKTQVAARKVAELSVRENLEATLRSVVDVTYEVLGCDAVTLHPYDPIQRKISTSPTMKGVWDEAAARRFQEVRQGAPNSVILDMQDVYIVRDTSTDPLFRDNSRFTREEKIVSCIGIPLKLATEPVGVMFANYRSPHRFSEEEINHVKLFALQATVAIRNAQLYDQRDKRLREREALARLSDALRGTTHSQEVLDRSIEVAADILEVDFAAIALRNRNGRACLLATFGWKDNLVGSELGETMGPQATYTAEHNDVVVVENYANEQRFPAPFVASNYGAQSGMSVPMLINGEVIGVISVNTRDIHRFSPDEIHLLRLIVNHTALALQIVDQYESLERKQAHMSALYQASKSITEGIGFTQERLLDHIVQQAVESIRDRRGPKALFGTLAFYDATTKQLRTVSRYCNPLKPATLHVDIGTSWIVDSDAPEIGITGLAVLSRAPQCVVNVRNVSAYRPIADDTQSELVAPLLDNESVLGVINLESDELAAFDADDEALLEALAEMVVMVLRNMRHQEEQQQAQAQVGRAEAIAWTSMASATWRHAISNHATTIQDLTKHLRADLEAGKSVEDVQHRLDRIDKMATAIRNTGITAPLASEDGVCSVPIQALLQERIQQLQEEQAPKLVVFHSAAMPEHPLTVRANPEWLQQAFDVILDNAIEAMSTVERWQLTVTVLIVPNGVEIAVGDTGKGMTDAVRAKVFNEAFLKPPGAKGSGIGLLLVQRIIQRYGGTIRVGVPSSQGTTMIVCLPIELPTPTAEVVAGTRHFLLVSNQPELSWVCLLKKTLRVLGSIEILAEQDTTGRIARASHDVIMVDAGAIQDVPACVTNIRGQKPGAKIIVVAAVLDWQMSRAVFQAGALNYVSKSISPDELRNIFNRILRMS